MGCASSFFLFFFFSFFNLYLFSQNKKNTTLCSYIRAYIYVWPKFISINLAENVLKNTVNRILEIGFGHQKRTKEHG